MYKNFCEDHRIILKKNKEKKEDKNLNAIYNSLIDEEELLKQKKRTFDMKLNEEIKRFENNYNNKFLEIFKKYSEFLRNLASEEYDILKLITMEK